MHDTDGILLSVDGDKGTTRASEGKGTGPLGVNALPPAWLCPEPCSFCRGKQLGHLKVLRIKKHDSLACLAVNNPMQH